MNEPKTDISDKFKISEDGTITYLGDKPVNVTMTFKQAGVMNEEGLKQLKEFLLGREDDICYEIDDLGELKLVFLQVIGRLAEDTDD